MRTMRRSGLLLIAILLLATVPEVHATPGLSRGSFAVYRRVTAPSTGGVLNGTFRWDVLALNGQPSIATIRVVNAQGSSVTNFTFYIELATRIEIPSFQVAYQNPSGELVTGADHATKTFFWIEPNPANGTIIDTVLGTAIVNGTGSVMLKSGMVKICWTAVSQSLGRGRVFGSPTDTNATMVYWYDQQTGLLVKLDAVASNQFDKSTDTFTLEDTNINTATNPSGTLTTVEWASLTMSIIALILGGIAVAVAMDLRQFRRKKKTELDL